MATINVDALNNAPAEDVAQLCFRLMDAISAGTPHIQVAAAAAFLITLAEVCNVEAQQIATVAKNLMHDPIAGRKEIFMALRDYIKHEVK